ncbi:uncharacterized protein A1O9_06706 [Exophiala aquamarina CBS 119918]|uniref:Cytochrome P450 oxidoreductase n=1 Tax=Exophiala aquamarina CBS 119918 TaxID=1182545 RepID=A0A072P8S7_9EURO|nr:uncharacterized protein A1O9_06706 [Exophiala aquamarina CBS 119918]KEF56519.1 hypothetical protein A1O9_06706 [Exophiala aquamarina CBS 119918]
MPPGTKQQLKPLAPPMLPYALPWLGHAMEFLSEEPGSFWRMLRDKLRATGTEVDICTILLGGQKAHVISSAAAVQALFKDKSVSRELFNHQLARNSLGTSQADAERMWPSAAAIAKGAEKDRKLSMEALNHEYLLSQAAVSALTSKFTECFNASLQAAELDSEWTTVDLLSWLKTKMFDASTTAVLGTKILEMNPDLVEQYWHYDAGFLPRFYGLPKWLKPEAYRGMEEMIARTEGWVKHVLDQCDQNPPEEPEWEPMFGAKLVRARHRFYEREGVTLRGKAAFDLGLLFGLSANAIPITGWILIHLLSPLTPKDVLPRILREVKDARRHDGEIDVTRLLSQPLLNSVLHETLRHYVDSLVTRQLASDTILDGYLLRKDDLIMAPSWLSQHDSVFWEEEQRASVNTWCAERFLRHNAMTGKDEFSSSWTSGKFFPFGGGGYICPGRVFAKQEILIALAMLLMQFEIKFVEYLGTDKTGTTVGLGTQPSGFPRVKRQYAGNGTLLMDGDIRVQLRRL